MQEEKEIPIELENIIFNLNASIKFNKVLKQIQLAGLAREICENIDEEPRRYRISNCVYHANRWFSNDLNRDYIIRIFPNARHTDYGQNHFNIL